MSGSHDDHPSRRARGGGQGTIDVRQGSTAMSLSDPSALPPRMRIRRAFTLVLLTLVAPGSAQIIAGSRGLGRFALRGAVLAVGLLVLAALTWFLSPSLLLGIASGPWFLGALTAALVLIAVFWAFLFLDALRLARLGLVPRPTRRLVALLTALLMALTSGPLLTAAWLVWAGRTAVVNVFGGGADQGPVEGRYNVLLLGSDADSDRVGVRPDTIMLASVDAQSGRSALFGFARDTENIDFAPDSTMYQLMPEGWNCGDQCLLNGLYQWAQENRDRFPADVTNPGALAMTEAVESLTGLQIQYYAMVDLVGFRRFVDAVGGLDVEVGRRTPMGGGTSPIHGYIEPGPQHLDGYHALWYARSREGASNYDRMARQKCVMTAMLHQLDPTTVVLRAQEIADISGGTVETNMPNSALGRMSGVALKARDAEMTTINFTPPLIDPWDYERSRIREIVQRAIAGDPDPTRQEDGQAGTGQGSTHDTTGAADSPARAEDTDRGDDTEAGATDTGDTDTGTTDPARDYAFSVSDDAGLICGVP